jgi:SWI/SNF-related matrix-associated actin-dependent regulator 1 of chromatin subfamily A
MGAGAGSGGASASAEDADEPHSVRKMLVFAHHKSVMNFLAEGLERRAVSFVRIDGATSKKERHRLKNAFAASKDLQVALVSIAVAGVGLSFVAAADCVFAELAWTPGSLLQAEDRV